MYKRTFVSIIIAIASCLAAKAQVTLEQCIASAQDNYPTIQKYNLIEKTQEIDLADVNRSWLPRLGLYAQGTIQNVVPSFPSTLSNVMHQMGSDVKGLGKGQYRLGLDLQQTVWDGGASRTQREISRSTAAVNQAVLDVDMYGIRQRVMTMYFGILLLDEQIQQTESAEAVYDANLQRLRSMLMNGVAMQSDADMVEAQLLGLRQQLTMARSSEKGYRDMLSIFTGMDLRSADLQIPSAQMPEDLSPDTPELSLFSSRMALNTAQMNLATVGVMPKIGLFAQSYYGYPGIDYFKAMMSRNPSFNILAGIKVSWNIDGFYNKDSKIRKLELANSEIKADMDSYLFNMRMKTTSEMENIQSLKNMMREDERIVALRQNVRKAAESQLRNGVIDALSLITKINDETQARLAAAYHSIQYVQAIHNLKNTINR